MDLETTRPNDDFTCCNIKKKVIAPMPIHLPPTSRRQFLSGLALGGSLALVRGRVDAACLGRLDDGAEGYVALLADTHINADPGVQVQGSLNLTANLRAAVADILSQPEAPRAAVVLGDLAQVNGQPGDYRQFLSLIRPLRDHGIPVHLALGNHDDRANFLEALKPEAPEPSPVADRCVSVVNVAGVRLVILDSQDKVNVVTGYLREAQREWLAKTLDADADSPTMVMVHHNPAPTPEQAKNCLLDTDELLNILRPRKHVKALVFGHTHSWVLRQDEGLHHVNLPAVAYAFGQNQPLGWCRFTPRRDGAAIQLHCTGGDRAKDKECIDLTWRTT